MFAVNSIFPREYWALEEENKSKESKRKKKKKLVPERPWLGDFILCFSILLPARFTSWAQMDSIGSVKGKLFTLKATTGSCREVEERQKQKKKYW